MARNEKGQFQKGTMHKDITGKRFGLLLVIKRDESKKGRKAYWICQCDCGKTKSIRSDTLNVVRSCGCLKKKQDIINLGIERNHNKTYHPAFYVWVAMMNRCHNEKSSAYENYGGRGISVCDEWHDVEKFCDWMDENGYEKGLTLERANVNGNYEPDNCELIPANEQAWNTRKTVYIEVNGEKIPLAKTARQLGLEPCLVWHRWNSGVRDYDKLFFKGNLHTEYKK